MPLATRAITADGEGFVASTGTRFDSLREALDAELAVVATTEKPLYFRDADTGELNGEMRWLPACDVEGAPVRGIRIDATAIEEMAKSLNSSPRAIPINGGPTPPGLLPSAPHGDVHDSSTLANGRAQWGVVVNTDATTKLYLYSEVMPHIARELDVGRLSEGSVCFVWGSTEDTAAGPVPRGVELVSHAFTNDPAVTTLEPTNSVREARRSISFAGAMRATRTTRSPRTTMKKTLRARLMLIPAIVALDVARRGPALDKLAEVAKSLGISIEDEMSEEAYNSPSNKAVCALRAAAEVEKILEGGASSTPAGQTARTDTPPPAEGALAGDPAADAKAVADAIKAYETATGKTGATIADVIAAIADMKPKGDGGAPAEGMEARQRDASIAVLQGKVATLEAEALALRPLAKEKAARDHADYVDAEAKKRGLTLTASTRAKLIALDKSGVEAALSVLHSPPSGSVMGDPPAASRAAGEGPTTDREAITACIDEAAKAAPGEPKHLIRSRARRLALTRWPHLFDGSAGEVA